jgi:hypothetical protein
MIELAPGEAVNVEAALALRLVSVSRIEAAGLLNAA